MLLRATPHEVIDLIASQTRLCKNLVDQWDREVLATDICKGTVLPSVGRSHCSDNDWFWLRHTF